MKLIDTHSHLYDEAFGPDREEALARAAAKASKRCYCRPSTPKATGGSSNSAAAIRNAASR